MFYMTVAIHVAEIVHIILLLWGCTNDTSVSGSGNDRGHADWSVMQGLDVAVYGWFDHGHGLPWL